MAVFKGNYHLDRAIDASLAIRKNIEALPPEHAFTPQVSIGIHSGEMISGNIGSATLKRLDFTVIGDTVNTAQRIQSAAGKNQIAIAENDYEKVKQAFECKEMGSFNLKNKEAAVKLYEVIQ
jgi:class 3 adenylate cyclase